MKMALHKFTDSLQAKFVVWNAGGYKYITTKRIYRESNDWQF